MRSVLETIGVWSCSTVIVSDYWCVFEPVKGCKLFHTENEA